jgi:hypothetical protein
MKNELTEFLQTLNSNKRKLTEQQYRTIKGQASAGDVFGARKGLCRVIRRGRR